MSKNRLPNKASSGVGEPPCPSAGNESTLGTGREIERITYHRLKLSVLEGRDRGSTVTWDKGRTLAVGRSFRNAFRLSDTPIFRTHFRIEPHRDGVILRDHDSRNGPSLDGVRRNCWEQTRPCGSRFG